MNPTKVVLRNLHQRVGKLEQLIARYERKLAKREAPKQVVVIIRDPDACYYCGVRADSRDHISPQSYVLKLRGTTSPMQLSTATVPACRECNNALNDRVLPDVQAKKVWIKKWLRRRYAKVLAMPSWSEEELAELGYGLRELTEAALLLRSRIKQRLAW